jgi:hypothetical protein
MTDFVCNYAPIRFLPYRETGEFVNVGVVVFCPEIDWFDYRLEMRKKRRAHGFFPELDKGILCNSLDALDIELACKRTANELQIFGNRLSAVEAAARTQWFKGLIQRREALLHFGDPGVLLAKDPRDTIKELFGDLVHRQFAHPKEYQEILMRRRLADLLKEWDFPYEKDKAVGDAEFHVKMPFVYIEKDTPVKVLKPFDLDKPDTNEIYNHGDAWVAKLQRLSDRQQLPKDVIFAVKFPDKSKRRVAADLICGALAELKVRIVEFGHPEKIREAACIEKKTA